MALPSSGNISLLDIKTEFGGDGALTSYYRGGAYVPNTATNAGVPTSGSIGLTHFYGASASAPFSASRTPSSLSGTRADSGPISRTITVTASGGTGSYTYNTTWLSGGTGLTIGSATTSTPSVSGTETYPPEVTRTGTVRTVVSDGVDSVNLDTPVSYSWGPI